MKILHTVTLALLSLSSFVPLEAVARSFEEIKKSGVIRVASDGATPGFGSFQGKDLVGFEIDLAELFAKRLGLKVEWKVQNFNTLLIGVNQDQFDLIAVSHAITPERMKAVDFVAPHYCTGTVLISKKGGSNRPDRLAGKKIVGALGTIYFDTLKGRSDIGALVTVPTETDGLQNVLLGKADAWATEEMVASQAIAKNKEADLEIGPRLETHRNAMVVAKGNTELLKKIDQELKIALKDGSYKTLSLKYFGKDIRCGKE